MSFSFGFAGDGGSDDEDAAPSIQTLPSTDVDGPEVPAAVHKLEDLVGRIIIIISLSLRDRGPLHVLATKDQPSLP